VLIAASTAAASVLSLSLPLPVHARRPRARITAIAAAFMATAAWRATMARCEVSKSGQYLHGSKINVPGCARRVRSEEECMCVCVCAVNMQRCVAHLQYPRSRRNSHARGTKGWGRREVSARAHTHTLRIRTGSALARETKRRPPRCRRSPKPGAMRSKTGKGWIISVRSPSCRVKTLTKAMPGNRSC